MIRDIALTSLVLVFGANAAGGQKPPHAPAHPRQDSARHQQGAPHAPPGGAQHDATHVRLAGSWHGTLNASHGAPSSLTLRVASEQGQTHQGQTHQGQTHQTRTQQSQTLTVQAQSTHAQRLGATSDVTLDRDRLSWTQSVGTQRCQVMAQLTPGTAGAPEVLQGTMRCGGEQMSFSLRKTTP